MKLHIFSIAMIIGLLAATYTNVTAQKFGHLNYGNLLDQMPEVQTARKELDSLKIKMVADGEAMAKAFEDRYNQVEQEYSQGLLTPIEVQNAQSELQKREQDLQNYEQQIQNTLASRRIELLRPIVERVEVAIQEVAKEHGYTFVFDSSLPNVMLFAEDQDDIAELVKKKLGM